MSTDFGLGNIGDYNIFSTMNPFLEKLLWTNKDFDGNITGNRNIAESVTGLHCLDGLQGWEAVPIIRNFFKRVKGYKLFEEDRTVLEDFPAEGVVCIMSQLAMLMADCINNPYERISVC